MLTLEHHIARQIIHHLRWSFKRLFKISIQYVKDDKSTLGKRR